MEIQEISTLLLECVQTDDVVGARRLLAGVDKRDRKSIVAKRDDRDPPLFVAAMRGNVDMVELLVKECHADTEELGRYKDPYGDCHLVTPLWLAAVWYKLKVLNCLINSGADINAVADNGSTPVLAACNQYLDIVKWLVEHGADVNKPDSDGVTCLMIAVQESKKISKFLIDNGANVNAQDLSGNTALHWAIDSFECCHSDKEEIVQLLIDHDSDPNIKNKDDEDVFLLAVLEGEESILNKLLHEFELPVRRKIELDELLGAKHAHGRPIDIEKVLTFWRKAVEMRKMHSCFDVQALQPNPVYLFAQEVNTVEELETLSQSHELLRMHALMITERILVPGHVKVQSDLLVQASRYEEVGEFRRSIDLSRYAIQLQSIYVQQRTTMTSPFFIYDSLYSTCMRFFKAYINNYCLVQFEEVFEVLRMTTFNVDGATEITLSQEFEKDETLRLDFMILILQLIKLITELDKNEDQLISFKKIVHRLVREEPKTEKGQTLLHLSVKPSTSDFNGRFGLQFPCIAVVKLLIECGANVNAVDNKNNTVLHLCSKDLQNLEMKQHHDSLKQIAVVLLKNEAHVDMVNTWGDSAAKSLASSLIDFNIQDYVSLKCLTACAVLKYLISYVGHIPASLESFVQMHGRSTADPESDTPL